MQVLRSLSVGNSRSRVDERGVKVFEYFRAISRSQGLDTEFGWDRDEVVIAT